MYKSSCTIQILEIEQYTYQLLELGAKDMKHSTVPQVLSQTGTYCQTVYSNVI